jgi:ribonuclease HII
MAILVGIDEAGFGPILGPLVVSSSAFRVPDNLVWANLWEILCKSVSEKRAKLNGRLLIADSKKAFTRSVGLKHLRKTVLATLTYLGKDPKSLTDLILALSPDCLSHLNEYPWYKKIDDYSLDKNNLTAEHAENAEKKIIKNNINRESAGAQIGAAMLKADCENTGVELLGLQSRILEVAHYNKMIEAVKNKAKVLFTAVAELMQSAIDRYKNENLEIVVDRQGGRSHYRRELQLMFEDRELRVIHEDQDRSSYELSSGKNKLRVHFVVGADDKFLPVSLASMVCKYLRELLVDNINEYFRGFNSAVKPTAGYWKDGLRFIEDLKTHIPNVKYDANQLIRSR